MTIHSPWELARAVRDGLRLRRLHLLPWQQERPNDTLLWWLVPSTDNPAHRHGKLLFSFDKDSPRRSLLGRNDALIEVGKIFVGLNIERGYGPQAFLIGKPRPDVSRKLDPQWAWHRVFDGTGPAQFARTLARHLCGDLSGQRERGRPDVARPSAGTFGQLGNRGARTVIDRDEILAR